MIQGTGELPSLETSEERMNLLEKSYLKIFDRNVDFDEAS